MRETYLLFYDGTCGLCRTAVALIRWLGPRAEVVFVDAADARQLARHSTWLTPARALQSVHLQTPGGALLHGYDAVVELVGLLPLFSWLVPLMQTSSARRLGWAIYEWVTAHRHGISHVLGLE